MWRYLEEVGLVHLVRLVTGWFFVALGLVGLVLPVLQGILFLALGALLLAPYVPLFRRFKVLLYRRFPSVRRRVNGWKNSFKARRVPRTERGGPGTPH